MIVIISCLGKITFLGHIDANVPEERDIHLIVDNYAPGKQQKARRWLAGRPRYHVHRAATYASWLDQVAIRFHVIT